jgi:hypothetical protein
MMKIILAGACVLGVSACAPEQLVVHDTVEVKIPVSVPCVTEIPTCPPYKLDTEDLRGKSIYVQSNAVLVELEQRRACEAELRAVLVKCAAK